MANVRALRPRASAIAFAFFVSLPGLAGAQQPGSPTGAPGLVDEGRRLFEGRRPFQNGGPACAACHAIATIGFPNGGTVGPDLSGVAERFGPEGVRVTLQTLFFPTMQPLYQERPLTEAEQQALGAFFAQASGASGSDRGTAVLAALALGGFLGLIAVAWLAWRGRLHGVRAPLVERAEPRGARP